MTIFVGIIEDELTVSVKLKLTKPSIKLNRKELNSGPVVSGRTSVAPIALSDGISSIMLFGISITDGCKERYVVPLFTARSGNDFNSFRSALDILTIRTIPSVDDSTVLLSSVTEYIADNESFCIVILAGDKLLACTGSLKVSSSIPSFRSNTNRLSSGGIRSAVCCPTAIALVGCINP